MRAVQGAILSRGNGRQRERGGAVLGAGTVTPAADRAGTGAP